MINEEEGRNEAERRPDDDEESGRPEPSGAEDVEEQGYEVGGVLDTLKKIESQDEEEKNQRDLDGEPDEGPGTPSELLSSIGSPSASVRASRALSQGLGVRRIPFGHRFSSQFSVPSDRGSLRPASPAFLQVHSRTTSLARSSDTDGLNDTNEPSAPWETVGWVKLKKLSGEACSESARRKYGTPTSFAVSAIIAVGMSRGVVLAFDALQNLKAIIGLNTPAHESGPVSAVAISSDHTTIAAGHKDGALFIWNVAKPSAPVLQIPALKAEQLQTRKTVGHLLGTPVIHISFQAGTATSLVSCDVSGMAFSHLAQRSITLIGLSCSSARILGRYFFDQPTGGKARKPSTILGSASLPLGNVEQPTDTMGITALLTPYLLVIISCVPVARTQHKVNRPANLRKHSMMSGCLAWFPAVRLQRPDEHSGAETSFSKLAYSWANVISIIEMRAVEVENASTSSIPELAFRTRTNWQAEEPVVAIQWFSRSVLAILTVTQRLIILEESTLRASEAIDISQRHIYHLDLFSRQLQTLVDGADEQEEMHGVTADAFSQSFRTYKSRIYLLGSHDLWVGAITNWADRLLAMMNAGDATGAIRLATAYFVGSDDRLIIGLPEDEHKRKELVQDKLLGLMTASMNYTFSRLDDPSVQPEEVGARVRDLCEACIDACIAAEQLEYLFDEVFGAFEEHQQTPVFTKSLEAHIMDDSIVMVPPPVMQRVAEQLLQDDRGKLETMICHMQPEVIDLDMMIRICKAHELYDALIYIYNRGLEDWTTPMISLMVLLDRVLQGRDELNGVDAERDTSDQDHASKIFPYLSYALTGRIYPTEAPLSDSIAETAKSQLLYFLFCGRAVAWPQPGGSVFHLGQGRWRHTTFAYLKAILKYDSLALLNVLDEAFEDDFLNDEDEEEQPRRDGSQVEYIVFASTINRQYIVAILLEILQTEEFDASDLAYLDIFVARNLPKYPQYLRLPEAEMNKILQRLCSPPSEDLVEDCQLSVEYLLSVYRPSTINQFIPLLEEAGYRSVLKSLYRSQRDYTNLIRVCLADESDPDSVFEALSDAARSSQSARAEAHALVRENAARLLDTDLRRTATLINDLFPDLHGLALDHLASQPQQQYDYLKPICESPSSSTRIESPDTPDISSQQWLSLYVQLMCCFEPHHVRDFIANLQLQNLQLDELLTAMEENQVVDAAISLMGRAGRLRNAMDRLVAHLETLSGVLNSLVAAAEGSRAEDSRLEAEIRNHEAVDSLMENIKSYVVIGQWLCQPTLAASPQASSAQVSKGRSVARTPSSTSAARLASSAPLTPSETLWLDLLIAVVQLTQRLPASDSTAIADVKAALRPTTQRLFTALLLASTTTIPASSQSTPPPRFTSIFRAFLTRLSTPTAEGGRPLPPLPSQSSYTDITGYKPQPTTLQTLSPLLADLFSAYTFESHLLTLVHQMSSHDLFSKVDRVRRKRERGWRPDGVGGCDGCGGRGWGVGVGSGVWDAWVKRRNEERMRQEAKARGEGAEKRGHHGKGKGKRTTPASVEGIESEREGGEGEDGEVDTLVVFACRHAFHRKCLERLGGDNGAGRSEGEVGRKRYACPLEKAA